MKQILSPHNTQLKHLAKLAKSAKYRRESRQTVLEGAHLLDALLQTGARPQQVYVAADRLDDGEIQGLLARLARRVFTAFPGALPRGEWVGNPLRSAFLQVPPPAERFAGRCGPLRLLVVGGSLGAKALNDIVPQALALLPEGERPQVLHQSGAKQIDALKAAYAAAGVQAETVPFIDDMAQAFADADWVICRAGAATVTELAAVGAAALFVPFPYAVDDHQSANARFLTDAGAGQLIQQADLTPQKLARLLGSASRSALLKQAQAAREKQKTGAAQAVADACQELRQP